MWSAAAVVECGLTACTCLWCGCEQTTIDQCDFIVDLRLQDQAEEPYSALPEWEVVWSAPFLDAAQSPMLTRAFFIPRLVKRNVYATHEVLRRKPSPASTAGRAAGSKKRRRRASTDEDDDEFVPAPNSDDLDAEL